MKNYSLIEADYSIHLNKIQNIKQNDMTVEAYEIKLLHEIYCVNALSTLKEDELSERQQLT